MVSVELNLLNIFCLRINKKKVTYEGETVGDIIMQFVRDHKNQLDDNLMDKGKKKLHEDIIVLLNGKDIKYQNNYKTELRNGDRLFISYPISGG